MRRSGSPLRGRGAYSLSEAARYASVHPNTVRSWFLGRSDGKGRGPILSGDGAVVGSDRAISFLDLIEVAVAGRLRSSGVTMGTVRQAHDLLQRELQATHPFAHSDIYTDGQRIFTNAFDTLGGERLHDVISRQQYFPRIRELLDHVVYNDETGMASRWRIAEGVHLDPAVSHGKPVVGDTGVTTYVVSQMYRANQQDSRLVADLLHLAEKDVINAVRFEEDLGWSRAA